MIPKLAEGVALLLYKGQWLEAMTDEVARETARFLRWENGINGQMASLARVNKTQQPRVRMRVRRSPLQKSGIAVYEDGRGRMWKQRFFRERGIMQPMIVLVQLLHNQSVCLITNRDGSLKMTVAPTSPLLARMQGRRERYFDAELEEGVVNLGEVKGDSKTFDEAAKWQPPSVRTKRAILASSVSPMASGDDPMKGPIEKA